MALSLYDFHNDKSINAVATASTAGLMSPEDKTKLSSLQNYVHPDTHPATMITGLAAVATSGSYNDLSDKPTGGGGTTLTDLGITATAAELNILDGVTSVTSTEINYLSGLTSNVQGQLSMLASTGGGTISNDPTFTSLNVTGNTNLFDVDVTKQVIIGETINIGCVDAAVQLSAAERQLYYLVAVNNKIYASSNEARLYSYDIETSTWTLEADLVGGVFYVQLAVYQNIIYAVSTTTGRLLSFTPGVSTAWTVLITNNIIDNGKMMLHIIDGIAYGVTEKDPTIYSFTIGTSTDWTPICNVNANVTTSSTILNGKIYLGTGNAGQLYSFTPGDIACVLEADQFDANTLGITALTTLNGVIYAGVAFYNRLLSFTPGTSTAWKLEADTISGEAQMVYSNMLVASADTVYSITYGDSHNGMIYSFTPGSSTAWNIAISTPLCDDESKLLYCNTKIFIIINNDSYANLYTIGKKGNIKCNSSTILNIEESKLTVSGDIEVTGNITVNNNYVIKDTANGKYYYLQSTNGVLRLQEI